MNDDTQIIRPVGERRARREAERLQFAQSGTLSGALPGVLPEVDEWRPVLPAQRPPVPGGRRERRLAEQAGTGVVSAVAELRASSLVEARSAAAVPSASVASASAPSMSALAAPSAAMPVPAPRRSETQEELRSLTQVAQGVAALPQEAPGGTPLTWDEVFATGVGLAPAPEEAGSGPRGAAANPTLLVTSSRRGPWTPPTAGWQVSDGAESPYDDDPGRRPKKPSVSLRRRWGGLEPRTKLAASVVAGVVTLGLCAGGAKIVLSGDEAPAPVVAAPHQATVLAGLVTSADARGSATSASLQSAALLATDAASGEAVSLLAPGSLILDVPGSGKQTLADAVRSGADAPANAVSDALEVRVDGSWLLTPSELSAVVDALGGITIEAASPFAAEGYSFPAGSQHLDGASAAAYATASTEGEPEQGRLARFEEVLAGTFAALPRSKAEIQALFVDRRLATGTLGPQELAVRLAALRAQAADDAIVSTMLPFEPVTVGDTTVSSLQQSQVGAVVDKWFSGAKLAESADGPVRVMVQNGVGVPGLSEAARTRLLSQGLRFVAGGNAQSFDYAKTKIVVPSDSAADRAHAQRVVEALGVPGAQIVVDPLGSSLAEVVAVIGDDFATSVTDQGVQPTP